VSWTISRKIADILDQGADFEGIDRDQALVLMRLETHSKAVYALMETANRMSRIQFNDKAENHLHIGINVSACPFNCRFCSLAENARIFTDPVEFSEARILKWVREAEQNGVDALNLMTTGTYSFERFLDFGRSLSKETDIPLVANTRDVTLREAEKLAEAGFVGAYHAVRLGEGRDTPFHVGHRIQTILSLKKAGLKWMNCIEPVGPEHSYEEIVDLMLLARQYKAVYSGVMRRVNFPGSPMQPCGMISELEMAKMVAVSRLIMGDVCSAHCTQEPHTASLIAGANLFFPEVGASPRDCQADTGMGRGKTVSECRRIFREMHWDPDLPSNCFEAQPSGGLRSQSV